LAGRGVALDRVGRDDHPSSEPAAVVLQRQLGDDQIARRNDLGHGLAHFELAKADQDGDDVDGDRSGHQAGNEDQEVDVPQHGPGQDDGQHEQIRPTLAADGQGKAHEWKVES
jgi:hypothetical protein